MMRSAVLSPCTAHGIGCDEHGDDHPRLYRYELRRRWDSGPILEWVMLNPSKADHRRDDPTIRRCIAFAKAWGYGGIVVRNLYALRATNPGALLNYSGDAIGPVNGYHLSKRGAAATVFAWGAHAAAAEWWNQPAEITADLARPEPLCLGLTASGMPRHPLYVRADATPFAWERS